MNTDPMLSVVIPLFNEKENLDPLTQELVKVLLYIEKPWEIIFIDDGSTDNSYKKLAEIKNKYNNITLIKFKKNCGKTAALDAGFKEARGRLIITMDADLQNDPRDIPVLLEHTDEYDIVCGFRSPRHDPPIRHFSSRIANHVRNLVLGEHIKDSACSLKAFRSDVIKKLKLYNGFHRFFPALISMDGGKVIEIKINHRPRKYGKAKYTIRNRIFLSFCDLLTIWWLKKRRLTYDIEELHR